MAINVVNSTVESYNFLLNQSGILLNSDTNDVTINGVNVIVDKPKRGDIMCVKNGQVIWIDGLSINPDKLSVEYEPVGICLKTNGNKAMVRYKEITDYTKWGEKNRWKVDISDIFQNGSTFKSTYFDIDIYSVNLDNGSYNIQLGFGGMQFTYENDSDKYYKFISYLNDFFKSNYITDCTIQVLSDTDESKAYNITIESGFPADGIIVMNTPINKYINIYASTSNPINFITGRVNGLEIEKSGYTAYRENKFLSKWPGVCKSKYYDWCYASGTTLNTNMTSINQVNHPVNYASFNSNYAKILQDTFATYDEYINANMVKLTCGAGGYIVDSPNGKENTYKLADCKLDDGTILYPAANVTASINVNAHNLGTGNWWLPSAAEMAEIMRDITYGTNSWETKPDIINRVLLKLNSFDSEWSMLSANGYKWTSSMAKTDTLHNIPNNPAMGDVVIYRGDLGLFDISQFNYDADIIPITIYEF